MGRHYRSDPFIKASFSLSVGWIERQMHLKMAPPVYYHFKRTTNLNALILFLTVVDI